jgi:hypothetical protein
VSFCIWLMSFNINVLQGHLFTAELYIVYTYHIFSTHSLIDGPKLIPHFTYYQLCKNEHGNIAISLTYWLHILWIWPKVELPRKLQIVFYNSSTKLHSHHHWIRVSFSPEPSFLFIMLAVSAYT